MHSIFYFILKLSKKYICKYYIMEFDDKNNIFEKEIIDKEILTKPSRFQLLTHWNELDKAEKFYLQNVLIRSSSIFGFLLVAFIVIYCFISIPGTTTNTSFIFAFILLGGFLAIIRVISVGVEKVDNTFFMGVGGIVVIFIGFAIYFFNGMNSNTMGGFVSAKIYQYLSITLLILIVLIGLAFFFILTKNWLYQQSGVLGLLINIVFYIPCLITDFFTYINDEFKITPKSLQLMFFAELIFIVLYFSIEPLYSRFINKQKNILLDKTEYLRNEKQYKINIPKPQKITKNFHKTPKNFGISCWFYINTNQPQNDDYLFFKLENTFATSSSSVKCSAIRLVYDSTTSTNEPIILTHNDHNIAIKNFGLQRWNYLFFNIENNILHLYINGILNTTMKLQPCFFDFTNANISPNNYANYYWTLTIGENDGISGAVRDIEYYNDSLLPHYILEKYNILRTVNI